VTRVRYGTHRIAGPVLLRLSDPVMLDAVRALTLAAVPYRGPGLAAMERCYDKFEASRVAAVNGVDGPATALAPDAGTIAAPRLLKPRRGSDSIGLRVLGNRRVAAGKRTPDYIVQEFLSGWEISVAVFRDRAGVPLRIFLPPGKPYSFLRKYLLRSRRAPLADEKLARRACETSSRIARVFGIDWAARVDLMFDPASSRLCFLECDAAPLVGAGSAFAASFAAAGVSREEQLRWLLIE